MNLKLAEITQRLKLAELRSHLNLAEVKKRLRARAVLAVSLESERIAVGVVHREEDGCRLGQAFTLPIGAEAAIRNPEKAGADLAAQLDAEGIHERRCVVCVPPGWALTALTDLPEVAAEDLRGYLELCAEREFPVPVTDLRLAHCACTLPDGKQHATLSGLPAKRIEAIEKMLEAAGCRAVSLSLGLDHCVGTDGVPAAAHFLANGTHVDVVITVGGGIAALRSLSEPVAGGDASDAAAFCREVRITLARLPNAVRQQVREARFGGTRATAEALCRFSRDQLRRMGIEPEAIDRTAHPAGAAQEAAERFLRDEAVTFEFVVPEKNRWEEMFRRFDTRGRRWIVGAALAFVVLPVLTFMVRAKIESSLAAEWKRTSPTVAELEALQQKIRHFRPWFDSQPQSLKMLEGLVGAFPEQGDVWAKNIEIGEAFKVTCAGFAKNQAGLMTFLDRLRSRPDVIGVQVQQVRGENPIQFSVTYKWEPKQ